jgi:hypothetical protein
VRYSRLEARLFATATQALVAEPVDPVRVDRFLAALGTRAPITVAWGLRALLVCVWLAPLLLAARFQSFLRAEPALQVTLWGRALGHRSPLVRQLALAVKALACLCHFDLESRR